MANGMLDFACLQPFLPGGHQLDNSLGLPGGAGGKLGDPLTL